MASTQDQSQNVCGICLASAASRGGVPLCCPGCCGKWFHQNCFDDLVKSGIQECPMCRTTFPNLVGAGAPPAPPVLQQQQQILLSAPLQQQQQQQLPQQAQQQAGIFNRLSSYFSTASISNSNVPTQNRNVVHQQQLQYSSNVYSPRFGGSPNSSAVPAMSAEEDKLSTEQIAANNSSTGGNTTSTTSNTTAAAATPRLTVSTTPEFPHTSLAVNNAFYARFSLKYEESAAAAGRKVPLDVVCVLDNSGSMSGSKIESLKKAMQFVMDTLGPDDRLAVVNFNSYATTLHGLLKMNPSNRTQAKDQIRALYATGGTDIYAGMKSGWDLLVQRQTKNPASCMFLLTDGQDTSNLREKLELAKQMKAAGTSLFVFGFGSDHDSEHMNAIANGAEGVFSYVESDDMVMDAFGGTIGTQQGLSLSNIQLTLDCAERDVKVVQLMTGYRHTLASTGRSGTVHFVNMFLGEQRDIIVKLSLPAVDSAVDDYELLRGSATFQITGSTTTYNAENVGICTVHRLPDNKLPVGTVRDLEVDIQLNRLDCTAAINAALSEADKSNFGAARDQLESAKIKLQTSVSYKHALSLSGGASSSSTTLPGNLNTVLALMQEIEDALQRVQSRSAYDNGGRAMMQEASNQNTYQRTTYNKAGRVNKYQSPASMQMQSCAFASKGSYQNNHMEKKWEVLKLHYQHTRQT